VIHDTQYTASEYPRHRGWGHSTMEYVVDLARAGAVCRLAMFHHDPLRHDAAVDELVARARLRVREAGGVMDVLAAAEGGVVELKARTRRPATAQRIVASEPAREPAEKAEHELLIAAGEGLAELLIEAAAADGIATRRAVDVTGAAALFAASTPSLVLASAALAGGGGAALCRAVRAAELPGVASTPVVLFTDASASEDGASGADERVALPISTMYARTRIRAWCLRRRCRWHAAPRPADEAARLHALAQLGLDEGAEERFDRCTRLAATLFRVRYALINLVDDTRQWTKSANRGDFSPLARDVSLCAHAVLSDEVLQIPDVARSEFADSIVMREGAMRFYAGVPLAAPDGSRVGTLCLMDTRPRELNADELDRLRDLGGVIERELAASSAT
jgi:DNA-binding response OmpR family regulator